MWVIYLEMGVALAILILIVWFTRPRKRPPAPPAETSSPAVTGTKDNP